MSAQADNSNFAMRFYQNYKWQIFIFFAIFIPLGAFRFFMPGLLHLVIDEVGTMATAAYLAGYDWSRVVAVLSYYGFGFTFFFAPLFYFELSPNTILLVIRLVNAALIALSGVLAYNIMTNMFSINNRKLIIITSIAAVCLKTSVMWSHHVWNDAMLIFLNWLVLYLLLSMGKRVKSGQSNIIYTLLLSVILNYGILVHTRMLFIWGAVFLVILTHFIISKKMLVNLWMFVPSFVLLLMLSRYSIYYVQNAVWLASGDSLGNTIESLGNTFSIEWLLYVLNISSMIAFFRTMLGQIWTTFIFTHGLLPLLFVSFAFFLVSLSRKSTRLQAQKFLKENVLLFLATVFALSQIAANIFLLSYAMIGSIQDLVAGDGRNVRTLLADRYFSVSVGPAIIIAISFLYRINKSTAFKILAISTAFTIKVNILFAYLVAPYVYGVNNLSCMSFQRFVPLLLMRLGDLFRPSHFLILSVFATVAPVVSFMLLSKRKFSLAVTMLLVFSVYTYSHTTIQFDINHARATISQYRHIVNWFGDVNISPGNHPHVYARSTSPLLTHIQFNLYRHSIVPIAREPGYPRFIDPAEIPIYVTNNVAPGSGSFNLFFGDNHKLVDLGEDEYGTPVNGHQVLINTADTALVAQIESAGYELSTFDTLHFDVDSLVFNRVNTEEELESFLAPSNIWLNAMLPAGAYELTIHGNDMSVELEDVLITMPDGITIADNELTYAFTLDYSRTLLEFFSVDAGWGFVEYLISNNIWYINQLEDMELRITERFPLRQLAAYEFGTAIYFDEYNANYHGHIMSGMPLQEESGAWTQGHVAEFVFFISDTSAYQQQPDLLFSFTAEPLVTPSNRVPEQGQPWLIAQRVEIEVNGEVLDVMHIIRHGTYEVRIPAELIADNNWLHIVLRLPTATSPAALDIDPDDDRVLALFLEEMRFTVSNKLR